MSCMGLEEQAESSMAFCWWFPAQQRDFWQFFPQHPIPASFVWFLLLKSCILPRLSHLFFSWITDVYSAPILSFSSSTVVWGLCALWWVGRYQCSVWWVPEPCSFTSSPFIAPFVAVIPFRASLLRRKMCHHFKKRLFTTRLLMERFKKKLVCSLGMKMLIKRVTGTGLPLPGVWPDRYFLRLYPQ